MIYGDVMMIYDDLWWFMMIYDDIMVIYGDFIGYHYNDSSCCHALVDPGKVATGRHMFGMSFSINNQRWIRGTGTWHSHWIKNHLSSVQNPSGWWIGTFFIFPYIGNFIIPTDELIFFRGVGLNHQPPLAGLMISGIILPFIYFGDSFISLEGLISLMHVSLFVMEPQTQLQAADNPNPTYLILDSWK